MTENAVPEPLKNNFFQTFFLKKRIWINVVLFIITVFTTVFVGLTWSLSYKYADILSHDSQISLNGDVLWDPGILLMSVVYAVVLLGILSSHELGHYLLCRYYKVDATLPYFIPAPTLIGTMGAFIRIRSPISRKQQLFDIGAAGPLMGFALSIPALVYGLSVSKVVPSLPREESIIFGEPLLLKFISEMIFKDIPQGMDVVLHPVAFAGWVGILVTALNLFPIGQLDGGHIIYAVMGKKARKFTGAFIGVFIIMGVFFWIGWFVWAVLLYFLGLKHPRIIDEDIPLSRGRTIIAVIILIIFIISFIPDPVQGYSLIDFINGNRILG